jgi:hypothetical protein
MDPDPMQGSDADAVSGALTGPTPSTERKRAVRALVVGAILGAALALFARRI